MLGYFRGPLAFVGPRHVPIVPIGWSASADTTTEAKQANRSTDDYTSDYLTMGTPEDCHSSS